MNAQIINLSAYRNARAAEEMKARQEQAKTAAQLEKIKIAAEQFGAAGGMLEALRIAKQEKALANTRPAYCNPSNEISGCKYQATKYMALPEVAKHIRADIKSAIQRGELPKGLKVSVKTREYAGGGSIDARVTAIPAGMTAFNPAYVIATKNFTQPPEHQGAGVCERFSDALRRITDTLKEIHGAYNRDNSDSMSDYFDVRYYGDVGLDFQLEESAKRAEAQN